MSCKPSVAAYAAQPQRAAAVIPLPGETDAIRILRRGSRVDVRVWTYPRGDEPVATQRGMTLDRREAERLVTALQSVLRETP